VTRLYRAARRDRGDGHSACELCAVPLAVAHDHLFDPRTRVVRCSCRACAMIIPSSSTAAYRLVPKRRERVANDVRALVAQLGIPVGVAALLVHDHGRVSVAFPGPAGIVESELDAETWTQVIAALPVAATLVPEVEAIVCSTLADGGAWRVGIDVVFELVGELRASWQGMTGGQEAPRAIARVLASLGGGA
jgi:hypothetical protein